MKKTISILWITALTLSLSSCSINQNNEEKSESVSQEQAEVVNQDSTETPSVKMSPEVADSLSKIKVDTTQTFEKVTELKKEVLIEWTWDVAKAGDKVSVHYYWRFIDGTKFDSSLDRGQAFEFPLWAWMVIKGWDEWVAWMKVWEVARLHIPSSLWYWEGGVWPIPWWSTLIFDVELLWINN